MYPCTYFSSRGGSVQMVIPVARLAVLHLDMFYLTVLSCDPSHCVPSHCVPSLCAPSLCALLCSISLCSISLCSILLYYISLCSDVLHLTVFHLFAPSRCALLCSIWLCSAVLQLAAPSARYGPLGSPRQCLRLIAPGRVLSCSPASPRLRLTVDARF